MKRIIALLLCIMPAAGLQASSITVSGAAGGIWSADTVKVAGDLIVHADTTLIIHPGTRVIFLGHYEIWVRGVIRAEGTSSDSIFFMVADTTGFSDTLTTAGGWHGIVFNQSPWPVDTSCFSFCRFENGKALSQDTTGVYGGVLRIFQWNKVVLKNCLFINNLAYKWGGAIYLKHADIQVEECTFRRNRCGKETFPWGYGGALCSVHSAPVIQHCLFEYNASTGIGGGASFEYSDPLLRYNIFRSNYSGLGGGFGFLRSYPVRVASNNLVTLNTAMFFGGGIACIRANTRFSNNTVTYNQSTYGGGFYVNDSAFPQHFSCLFYGNFAFTGQEVYIWDILSAPDFFYCNIPGGKEGFEGSGGQQGYHGLFENNTDTIPDFISEDDFRLKKNSPMTDAGIPDTSGLQVPIRDLFGEFRFYNNRIDIGACEWNPGPYISETYRSGGILEVFPNPSFGQLNVRFFLDNPSRIYFSLIDRTGKAVWSSPEISFREGEHTVSLFEKGLELKFLRAGVYEIILSGKDETRSTRFVKIP